MTRLTDCCIFCEAKTALTAEHSFWPNWAKKYLPAQPKGRHEKTLYLSSKSNPNISGLYKSKRHHGEVNVTTLRVVCGPHCNNGWMRECENITRPILAPLILGQPAVLSKDAQQKLAFWIAMKAMVSEFSEPFDVATPQQYRNQLMNTGQLPPGWIIFVGHVRGKNWRMGYHRHSAKFGITSADTGRIKANQSPLLRNTYSITVGIGELLIWAVAINAPNIRYQPPGYFARFLRQIWPYQREFLWPLGPIFSDRDADTLCRTLHNAMRNIPWAPDEDTPASNLELR